MFAAEAVVVVAAVAGGSFAHSRKRGTQTHTHSKYFRQTNNTYHSPVSGHFPVSECIWPSWVCYALGIVSIRCLGIGKFHKFYGDFKMVDCY